jgi:hypothetical protein
VADLIDKFVDSPWLSRLVILFAIGIVVNFAGLSVVVLLLSQNARQGRMAREMQQAKYPVSLRLYEDAHRRGVISAAELECFRDWRACPPPKTP